MKKLFKKIPALFTFGGMPALATVSLILAFIETIIHPVSKHGFDYMSIWGKMFVSSFYISLGITFILLVISVIKELNKQKW